MRFASSATLALTIALVLGGVAHGQPPPYELRTMLVESAPASQPFGMSKLRLPYLCPECGYSSMAPGVCPDPFGTGHDPTALAQPVRPQERVLDVLEGAAGSADIRYEDTAGAENFLSVIGRPFQPGREVFAQFAWPDRPAGWANARAHFVTLPPGTKEPHVWYDGFTASRHGDAPPAPEGLYHDAALYRDGWQEGETYAVGDRVSHGVGYRGYVCTQAHTAAADNRPGSGPNWHLRWDRRDLVEIRLNPNRVADGDTYYVRYFSFGFTFFGSDIRSWRLLVYSRLHGLEFDSGLFMLNELHPQSTEHFRVVTASGAVRLDMAIKADPNLANDINANWQMRFRTHSNAVTSPPPERGPEPERLADQMTGFDMLLLPMWQNNGVYYPFTPTRHIVTNRDPVGGDTTDPSPAAPYEIASGEVETGRVHAKWRSEAGLWEILTGRQDRLVSEPDEHGGTISVRHFYYAPASNLEWRYDTLTGFPESGPLSDNLAPPTPGFPEEYRPIESRFMVSRYQVPPTGDTDYQGNAAEISDYPRVLAGRDDGGARVTLPGETATRRDGLRLRNLLHQGEEYYRCPACGATFDEEQDHGAGWPNGGEYPEDEGHGVCPYHGDHSRNADGSGPEAGEPEYYAPGPRVGLQRIVPTGRKVFDSIVRSLTVPEVGAGGIRWLEAFPTLRPQIPDEAVRIARQGQYVPLGSAHAGYEGAGRTVAVHVPRHQTASEPGQLPGRDRNPNLGYRGGAITFQDTIANVTEYDIGDISGLPPWAQATNYSVDDEVSYAGRGYRCIRAHRSNHGRRPDRPGGARFWTLTGEWRTTTVVDENARWDMYLECPDCGMPHEQSPALLNPDDPGALPPGYDGVECSNAQCPGHEWCPVCGSVFMVGMAECPFDGAPLVSVQPGNVGHRHLAAEEFAGYDVEVAVLKRTELVAQAQAAGGGRVAPGIDPDEPDQTVAAAGGTPSGRRADPADISHFGRTVIRNEGNTIPVMTGVLDRLYRLFRPEADQGLADQGGRSYGWAGTRNPVAGELIREYYDEYDDDAGEVEAWPMPDTWQLVSPPAGAVTGTAAGVSARVGGFDGDAGRWKAVGTGQVLGRYSGPLVYYLDTNENGVFDFETLGGSPLNSAVAVFDPERHVALEPYIISHARVRVSEAPFPFNSYLARDLAPTPRFDYDALGNPVGLRVLWMTNRNMSDPSTTNLLSHYAAAFHDDDRENRTYVWDTDQAPLALTASTAPFAQNGPADIYADGVGPGASQVYLWHSTGRDAGGLVSALRSYRPSTNQYGYLWTGRERAEGVRGFFDPDVANVPPIPLHWAFWHAGQGGQERIMYAAWQPDGSAPGGKRIVKGGPLPVDNTIVSTDPTDTVETFWDPDGIGPQASSAITIRKYPRGPFAAVKDVSPLLYLPPVRHDSTGGASETQPQIRVFFAGQARHLHNFDIYEARFNRADFLTGTNNDGKQEFPVVRSMVSHGSTENLPPMNPSVVEAADPGPGVYPGEELRSDARRQEFHSRHLDWLTGSNFLNDGSRVSLSLGVKLQGVPRYIHYYDVQWGPASPARGEGYDRTRGVYVVIPRFRRYDDDPEFDPLPLWSDGPAVPAPAPNADWAELVEPETFRLPAIERRPIKMEIDPVLGRVRFSAPLFNPDNPADESAVFSSVFPELRNPDGSSRVVDVFLCADYSPFLWRHTMSPANDDNPTAIMMRGPWHGNQRANVHSYPWPLHSHNQGLTLFWRRTYGSGQAPYYGRTSYMMAHESGTVRTNHAPIINLHSVETPGDAMPDRALVGPGMPTEVTTTTEFPDLPAGWDGAARPEFDVDYANGEIAVWTGTFRWVEYPNGDQRRSLVRSVRVVYDYQYVDADGNVQTATANEVHTIGGWSEETVLPIDTVLSEGPLRVAEETFRTPALPIADAPDVVGRRYWVFWTSPRPIYDLRRPGDGGSEVRQASNIYYCAVTPEHPTLLRHRRASSNARDRFQP